MTNEEAIEYIKTDISRLWDTPQNLEHKEALEMAIKALKQEPKTGHWIIIDDCEHFMAKCSECGAIVDSRMLIMYPYCHCGAKMEA